MKATLCAAAQRDIAAPAGAVYALFADYENGHPRVLPPAYLSNLRIEKGGQGAGTVFTCEMRVMGQRRLFRALVTEPAPGRVLRETIPESGMVTTFTVEPLDGGRRARAQIETRWEVPRWRAPLERGLLVPFLRRVYRAELELVAREAARPIPEAMPLQPR